LLEASLVKLSEARWERGRLLAALFQAAAEVWLGAGLQLQACNSGLADNTTSAQLEMVILDDAFIAGCS
jgi:hypothetical protein